MTNVNGQHHTGYRSIDATPLGDAERLASGEAVTFAGNGATGWRAGAGTLGFHGADLGSSAPTPGRVPSFLALAERTGGTYLEDTEGKLSVEEALGRVGLDFTVRHNKIKVVETEFVLDVNDEGKPEMVERETGRLLDMPAWRATVGYPDDGGDPFAIAPTSPGYAIMQNRDALAVGDEISGGRLRALGAFGKPVGARVYGAWELGDGFDIAGDPYRNFVTIIGSHDRSSATIGLMAPIRIGCTNQGSATFGRKATPRFGIQHRGNAALNVVEARKILGISKHYTEVFTENMQALLTKKMTTDDFVRFERQVFGIIDFDELKPRQKTTVEVRDEQLLAILGSQTCQFGAGTLYAGWNAATEYLDWYGNTRGADDEAKAIARASQLLAGGTIEDTKSRAWNIAAELVAA